MVRRGITVLNHPMAQSVCAQRAETVADEIIGLVGVALLFANHAIQVLHRLGQGPATGVGPSDSATGQLEQFERQVVGKRLEPDEEGCRRRCPA